MEENVDDLLNDSLLALKAAATFCPEGYLSKSMIPETIKRLEQVVNKEHVARTTTN